MRMLSLCSGIGGFDLAAEWAGMEVVGQVEIDSFCQKVLAKHWPNVKRVADIKEVVGDEFGPVDIICSGFPCQPFSVAGKRKGKEDDRYLWPEVFRIIKITKPSWVIIENVSNIVRMALDDILLDLENSEYESGTFIIPACAANAPHRRNRVWIVAHSTELQCDGSGIYGRSNSEIRKEIQEPRNSRTTEDMANPNQQGLERWNVNSERSDQWSTWKGGYALSSIWSIEPDVGRVAHGVPQRVDRLKGLGNAIVPQVAYMFLKEIVRLSEI